jgi:redox-sensitive bicupin YhaK (pirin superfamily)
MEKTRPVLKVVSAEETSDGAGVRLKRSLGGPQLPQLDPFLLLDEFRSDDPGDYIAGFPDHPHRGFETVTYVLAGSMHHEDHAGHKGDLVAGSVQWMTAGRGIIHSEMPRQKDGLLWGFQLWVNLPAHDKMGPPRYQEFPPSAIPEVARPDGTKVRVVAGQSAGVEGPVLGIATSPLYLDVALPEGTRYEQELPAGHNALCYVYEGRLRLGPGRAIGAGHLAILGEGHGVAAEAADSAARFLLLAARPIGEPIARYGPFVMNTREELARAFEDFRNGTFLG